MANLHNYLEKIMYYAFYLFEGRKKFKNLNFLTFLKLHNNDVNLIHLQINK